MGVSCFSLLLSVEVNLNGFKPRWAMEALELSTTALGMGESGFTCDKFIRYKLDAFLFLGGG